MSDVPAPSCVHAPRRIEWPGGHADLTANGNWTAYFADRLGEVFAINACPGCLVALWGLPACPPIETPAVAYSSRWRPPE